MRSRNPPSRSRGEGGYERPLPEGKEELLEEGRKTSTACAHRAGEISGMRRFSSDFRYNLPLFGILFPIRDSSFAILSSTFPAAKCRVTPPETMTNSQTAYFRASPVSSATESSVVREGAGSVRSPVGAQALESSSDWRFSWATESSADQLQAMGNKFSQEAFDMLDVVECLASRVSESAKAPITEALDVYLDMIDSLSAASSVEDFIRIADVIIESRDVLIQRIHSVSPHLTRASGSS